MANSVALWPTNVDTGLMATEQVQMYQKSSYNCNNNTEILDPYLHGLSSSVRKLGDKAVFGLL